MRLAIKNQGKAVRAWQLGASTAVEQKLIDEGKIVFHAPDRYEVFSQEAAGGAGEIAFAGDYIKVDSCGRPYPNDKAFFEANHTHVKNDEYIQTPKPLPVWFLGNPEEDIISFLLQHRGLRIDPQNADACFSAPLWGTTLTAKSDAAIVIYKTVRDSSGNIVDVDFNFVARDEFDQIYQLIDPVDKMV